MKSLSVIFTIMLLVLANKLAVRLKQAGATPADLRDAETKRLAYKKSAKPTVFYRL